ncbi:MAG TPA: hypothetical protein VFH38_08080 [Jatrophihabitans sp.]|nr:hypothetical protein [Jatrophihabitans sp.]
MALFRRRERPPEDLLAMLEPSERAVSWADAVGETVVLASSLGLWWPFPDGPRRMPWQLVDKVVWRDGIISVTEADVVDDLLLVDRPAVSARLATPRDLPPVVRRRVENNIVRRELLQVTGGAARIVARRQPGRDGAVWWARLEPGTPDTAPLRAAIRARIDLLRAESELD